jgi:hypothetical protein
MQDSIELASVSLDPAFSSKAMRSFSAFAVEVVLPVLTSFLSLLSLLNA